MSTTHTVRKVNGEDMGIFDRVVHTLDHGTPAVVTTKYRDQDVAVLVNVTHDGDEYVMEPLAILVTADMLVDLEPASTCDCSHE